MGETYTVIFRSWKITVWMFVKGVWCYTATCQFGSRQVLRGTVQASDRVRAVTQVQEVLS